MLSKKITREKPNFPPLEVAGEVLLTVTEKVEALASNFEQVHLQNRDLGDREHDRELNTVVSKFFTDPEKFESGVELSTTEELKQAICGLKNRKSPGNDGVRSIFLKNFPQIAIPSIWKQGIISPILKPDKNSRHVGSYRQITLLTIFSKILEKVIAWRLNVKWMKEMSYKTNSLVLDLIITLHKRLP